MPRSQPNARKGLKNRVPLSTRISAETSKQLAYWGRPLGTFQKLGSGVVVDRLVSHALRTNFNPAHDCL